MRTITRRAAMLITAGTLGLAALASTAPALAGAGPFGPANPAATGRPGPWMMSGPDTRPGIGGGMCAAWIGTAAQGTLTDTQRTTLASMAPEEKLAHDLYAAFADRYGTPVFAHVAMAESRHLDMVRTLLSRYGVADPTADQPAGRFTDPAVRARYDTLLAQGGASRSAALAVARQAERDDIAVLTAALGGVTAPDVLRVYTTLLMASQQHLTAFTG